MNYVKLHNLTDLTLTLFDGINKISINVHKNILYSSCIYFEKLLTNCKEKNSNNITINVPNTHLSYDIIMSFYHQKTNIANLPPWKHLLESCKCYDFFGLEMDPKLLFDFEIPADGFELLLEVIELIGYDEDMIKLINKNIPDEYDLSKFPKELLINMLEAGRSYHIVSGSGDKSIKIWDVETGELVRTLEGHTGIVLSVCYSPDNKQIASGSADQSIKIWNAETGKLVRTLDGHTNWVHSVCYSPDDKRIASGSFDQSIKIWDTETGKLIRTLDGHTDWVRSVCYSPDNKRIASGSADNSIKIWDAETGQLVRTLVGHTDMVLSVCYSPDNKRIASGSADNSIKIWDAETGELVRTLEGHTGRVQSVCYSSNYDTELTKKIKKLLS